MPYTIIKIQNRQPPVSLHFKDTKKILCVHNKLLFFVKFNIILKLQNKKAQHF